MKSRVVAIVLLCLAAFSMTANPTLFAKYESVRQALLNNSLKDVQTSAAALATAAKDAKQPAIAAKAESVAKLTNLDKARDAFAPLSDEMIKLRAATPANARPVIGYCPMVKKSWLQPDGKVGNPYLPDMSDCGELK